MPTQPVRVQLRRSKGFRLQEVSFRTNGLPAVKVDRGNIFGNPFSVEMLGRKGAVDVFRRLIAGQMKDDEISNLSRSGGWGDDGSYLRSVRKNIQSKIELLREKNLACWCRLDVPCHADVLLHFANSGIPFVADMDPAQRVHFLEKENARLRRLVTDLATEKQILENKEGG